MSKPLKETSNAWRWWLPIYKYTWERWQQSSYRHFAANVGENKVVLDIGTGTGAYIKMLPKNNYYIFTDIDSKSLKIAKVQAKKYLSSGTYEFDCCDATTAIKQHSHANVISMLHVITVIPLPEQLLDLIAKTMQPETTLHIYVSGFSKKMPNFLNKLVKFLGFNVIKVQLLHKDLSSEKICVFNERYLLTTS